MMNMKWKIIFISILGCLLSACSNSLHPSRVYYQLPLSKTSTQLSSPIADKQLWVKYVTVADYLEGAGIVYQTSDVSYSIGKQNVWASPLEQQLKQTLINELSRQLPDWIITSEPTKSSPEMTLTLQVNGFHGRYDGQAVIEGSWLFISNKGKVIKKAFNLQIPLEENGYPSLVRALSQGWQEESKAIAIQINQVIH